MTETNQYRHSCERNESGIRPPDYGQAVMTKKESTVIPANEVRRESEVRDKI